MSERSEMIVRQFRSNACQCGRYKRSREPFCGDCWAQLEGRPVKDHRKLVHIFGEEYETLYFRCIDFLTGKKGKSQ
jgi:hypothetical protein